MLNAVIKEKRPPHQLAKSSSAGHGERECARGKMKQARHRDAILRMDPEVLILLSVVGSQGGQQLRIPE